MTTEDLKSIFNDLDTELTGKSQESGMIESGEVPITPEQEEGFQDWNRLADSMKCYYFLIDPDLDNELEEEQFHFFEAESLFDAVVMAYHQKGPMVRGLTRIAWKDSKEGSIQAVNVSASAPVNAALIQFRPMLIQLHIGPSSWAEGEWGAPDFRSERYRAYQQRRVDRYG